MFFRKKIDRVSDASTTTTPSMPTIAYESTLEPSIMFDDYSQYHHQRRPRTSTDDDEDETDRQQSNEMYRHDYYYRNPPVDRHYQSCVAAADVITVSDDTDQDDRHGTFDRKNSLPTSLNVANDESSSFRRSHSYTSDSSRSRTMMMMRDDQHILPWNQSVFDTRYETKRVWPHQRVTPRTIKKRRKHRGGDEDMNQLPSPMMISKKVQFSDDIENTPV
jgi:hypothetical protein